MNKLLKAIKQNFLSALWNLKMHEKLNGGRDFWKLIEADLNFIEANNVWARVPGFK